MAEVLNQSRIKHVQELANDGVDGVPQQYITKDLTLKGPEIEDSLPFMELPVIDFNRLASDEEELEKLREAFSSWGCFHIINHGMEAVTEEMRKDARKFFQLPMEEKLKYAKQEDDIEGYGNDKAESETQSMDWVDRLFLTVAPEDGRKMHLWPENPQSFRKTLHQYTEGATSIIETLLQYAATALGLTDNVILSICGDKPGSRLRINYYPPCPRPEFVFGLKEHTDGSVITIVMPDKDVEGFQFHKDNQWYRVCPVHGALEVNIGDQLQIFSNGIFKSVVHRAVTNKEKERMTTALFWNPEKGKEIGPLEELIDKKRSRLYKTLTDYTAIIFEAYLKGMSPLEAMRL